MCLQLVERNLLRHVSCFFLGISFVRYGTVRKNVIPHGVLEQACMNRLFPPRHGTFFEILHDVVSIVFLLERKEELRVARHIGIRTWVMARGSCSFAHVGSSMKNTAPPGARHQLHELVVEIRLKKTHMRGKNLSCRFQRAAHFSVANERTTRTCICSEARLDLEIRELVWQVAPLRE